MTGADLKKVKKEGFLVKSAEIVFPSDEVIPCPPNGFRVMFLSFLVCGLSLPAHKFLHGILFVYGVQMHQLTPNFILHIAYFITLYEAFLGIGHHCGLWKHIFHLRRNVSKEEIHDLGGAIISVRPESQYLRFNMADSVQNWRQKWFCIKDQKTPESDLYGLALFDALKGLKKMKS
jgi:hypothetical protein